MAAVLHCAGPFSRTSPPDGRRLPAPARPLPRHHRRDRGLRGAGRARRRGPRGGRRCCCPASGFDVVPSDCLAAHLKRRLPSATHLVAGASRPSAGSRAARPPPWSRTCTAAGAVRRDGADRRRVPPGWKTRDVDFGRGPRRGVTIPWGDVSTAFHSTGIPNIEVYAGAARRRGCGRPRRVPGPLLASAPVQAPAEAADPTRGRRARPPSSAPAAAACCGARPRRGGAASRALGRARRATPSPC